MITSFIAGKLLPYLLAAGGAVIAFFGVYMKGRSAANKKHKADAKAAKKRLETIDKVERITRDAEEISDSDLVDSLIKRR